MSVSLYRGQVDRLTKEIADLEKKAADERGRAAKERGDALRKSNSIGRGTSVRHDAIEAPRGPAPRGECSET